METNNNSGLRVYISGALTSVWEKVKLKVFYEEIGRLCQQMGLEPYIPHNHNSLDSDPGISCQQMYDANMNNIDSSNLLIAYVGAPSQGTGMEIERAYLKGIDVIILCEKDREVSRMVRGCPGVKEKIFFADYSTALASLGTALSRWLDSRKCTR